MGGRLVYMLVDCQQHLECCCVEDSAFVPFVVRINDRSFEDRKRTLEEIKFLFFNTVYLWTAFFFFFFLVFSYHDFFAPTS
jgi:hypothetical protein